MKNLAEFLTRQRVAFLTCKTKEEALNTLVDMIASSAAVEDAEKLRKAIFDREKIKRGLLTACKKRPVSLQTIEDIVNRIEIELYEKYDREVKSTKIGDLVMRELKAIDHVAYVRFASVYREFKDVCEFMRELRPMLKTGARS